MQTYIKDIKDIRKSISLEVEEVPSVVYVLAVATDNKLNERQRICCAAGMPISGYRNVYEEDEVLIRCVDNLKLGNIPISYRAKMLGCGNWKIYIPMPESVIKRYLNLAQRKMLKEFKNKHNNGNTNFEFIQMTSSIF